VEDEDRPVNGVVVFGLDGEAGQLQGLQAGFTVLRVAVKQGHVLHRRVGGHLPEAHHHALGPGVLAPSGMTAAELKQTLEGLTDEIMGQHRNTDFLLLVGDPHRRGVSGAAPGGRHQPAHREARTGGDLDIARYRDDWTQLSHKPLVGKMELPGSIDDQEVVLVDDVAGGHDEA